jgi:hypothetical protein
MGVDGDWLWLGRSVESEPAERDRLGLGLPAWGKAAPRVVSHYQRGGIGQMKIFYEISFQNTEFVVYLFTLAGSSPGASGRLGERAGTRGWRRSHAQPETRAKTGRIFLFQTAVTH